MNTAIDQNLDKFRSDNGREPTADEESKIRAWVLQNVRGTVQADILKEDQGQNTCIFSTEFSLKVMGDIQAYFVHHQVRNFYSVSISGYHIAEAGANPISQLAFTLANGFTYVETYLARGMHVDDFAPNLSFFFSNGMDPEYSVLGRVARRTRGGSAGGSRCDAATVTTCQSQSSCPASRCALRTTCAASSPGPMHASTASRVRQTGVMRSASRYARTSSSTRSAVRRSASSRSAIRLPLRKKLRAAWRACSGR
ncbi:UNVERIFIED_CONTAM: methylmalonyl-CoA mutase family protein [Microbacterium sp. SLM126]